MSADNNLPAILPIFPLTGAVLLPRGHLPLNIFEPRYKAMVDEALGTHRMVGMIQPKGLIERTGPDDAPLYKVGCVGKITKYEETDDGRYLITLHGVTRFSVGEELPLRNGFRRIRPGWDGFSQDLQPGSCVDLDREALKGLLKDYFSLNGLNCTWEKIDTATDEKLITCLSMACPLEPGEKQALLEAATCSERAKLFMTILQMALREDREAGSVGCRH